MSTTLAHHGLPPGVTRFDLLRKFEQVARPGFGLSSTAVALVRLYVLKTMDCDYAAGRICAVWTQACRFAENLGLTPRSVNTAERDLEDTGFIARTAGINGSRNGDRNAGVITWAAGINLAPLIDRFSELAAKAEAMALQARAMNQCRAEIRQLGKVIREADDEDLRAQADRILPNGRTARIGNIHRLGAVRDALAAIVAAIETCPADTGRALKTSDAPEANCAPNIQKTKKKSPKGTPRLGSPPDQVTPAVALSVATEPYRQLVDSLGGATWPNLVEASWRSCHRLRIAKSTWGHACQHFGRERAALCVLLIDRNTHLPPSHRYHARYPGRCLTGMMREDRNGGFNLHGLFRASQHDQDLAQLAEQALFPGAPQSIISRPLCGGLAQTTADILARLATHFKEDGA